MGVSAARGDAPAAHDDRRYAIAIDGGGGKTDAVAVDADGTVLARARAGGSSPQILGLDRAVEVVDGLIRELIAELGSPPAHVHTYLSGLDLPEEVAAFRAAVDAASWAPADPAALVVENDLFALLRAGTDEPDAAAVVCGTGINAIGVRADGRIVRFPALGNITGDWGGGWQLGEQAVWHAARALDGRGPATTLTSAAATVFGMDSVDELIRALHFGRLPMSALSALAPSVFAAAARGDEIAGTLVDRQAEEIVTLAATTLRRLDLLGASVPVVLGGGVIAGGDERLLGGIRQGLAQLAPFARPTVVRAAPVVGAALLAAAALRGARTASAAAVGRTWSSLDESLLD